MISDREGFTTRYAIFHLQERGIFFVGPGEPVYEGMIVGEYAREINLPVNVCREKKLTNMRASGHDEAVRLSPPRVPTLDAALEWIDEEELVEGTPKSVGLRTPVVITALSNKNALGLTHGPPAQLAERD